MKKTLLAVSIALMSASTFAETRTESMGGAGVASGNYLSASFVNPALLTSHEESDDFGLLLPSVNFVYFNSDDLVDNVDALQDSYTNLEDLLNASTPDEAAIRAAAQQLSSDFASIDGSSANVEGNFQFAISIPNKYLGVTLFGQSYVDASAYTVISQSDIDALNELATSSDPVVLSSFDIDDLTSSGLVMGAAVTDFGITLAKSYEIQGYNVSFGISPKYQRVDTFNYLVDIESFDEDDFDADNYTNDDSSFNVDLGATVDLTPEWRVGLTGMNLVKETYSTVMIDGQSFEYKISPQFTAGVAYNTDFVTVALDVQLNESKKFSMDTETQYASLGAELNAFDWAQVRVGYRHDMSGNKEDLYSAGLGFSPFGVVRLDVMAMYAGSDEFGVGVQTSYTF